MSVVTGMLTSASLDRFLSLYVLDKVVPITMMSESIAAIPAM